MERLHYLQKIQQAFAIHPIVALLGPRQCGKTTLAKMYSQTKDLKRSQYFDLENVTDLVRLENPQLTLEELKGLIIIDEIQRRPELFPTLRVLVDEHSTTQNYLILGSASRELIKQASESLAGRIHYLELTPFNLSEAQDYQRLWLRGGFPRSFLAINDKASYQWREQYISNFLEQDLPMLGVQIPAVMMRRFWMMLSHYHGNIFNASEIARSLSISDITVKRYLDILAGTFMVRQLQPWHENIGKRQVKSPKIYFRDSGILHNFLRIETYEDLLMHPKLGATWEGFALEEIIRKHQLQNHEVFFWATHSGAELDLFAFIGKHRVGFEFKYTDTPKITKSMYIALEDLKLDHLYIIYPGKIDFKLEKNIEVVGLKSYLNF